MRRDSRYFSKGTEAIHKFPQEIPRRSRLPATLIVLFYEAVAFFLEIKW